ncbi:MAG: PQQ-dependent sugar dehydrogenase [Ferruginibacter sp.]
MIQFYKSRSITKFFLALLISSVAVLSVKAQPIVSLTPVITSGLNLPIQFVHAGDNTNRVFIVQQGGTIRAYDAAFNFLSNFLTVSNITFGGEQGLLSMAFHPDYKNNGFFYVYYVNTSGDLEVARYHVSSDPNVADAASKVIVITIPHPTNTNHNGGELHFGSDGFLYLSTGDGGGAGDVPNNAQNTTKLLGKILRFNVTTSTTGPYYTIPPGNPFGNVIFDLGLRNPFRWSFDRQTNDMWIGDVGQDSYEEIDFRAAGSTGGVNYGWHCYEGDVTYNTTGCGPITNYVFPAFTYPSQNPSAAITGGIVYRGTAYPALFGYNLSADFYSGILYKTVSNGAGGWNTSSQPLTPTGIVDFGETENGEGYAISLTAGSVYRITATGTLPVISLSFGGVANNEGVNLNWKTAGEENLRVFEMEYSLDGAAFTYLGTTTAKNAATGYTYSFLHSISYDGSVFYRLKMIDMNGTYKYSGVFRIVLNGKIKNIISPSFITDGMLNLNLFNNTSIRSVEIINAAGARVLQKNVGGQTGNIKVPVGHLSTGVYMVRMLGNSITRTEKVFIH